MPWAGIDTVMQFARHSLVQPFHMPPHLPDWFVGRITRNLQNPVLPNLKQVIPLDLAQSETRRQSGKRSGKQYHTVVEGRATGFYEFSVSVPSPCPLAAARSHTKRSIASRRNPDPGWNWILASCQSASAEHAMPGSQHDRWSYEKPAAPAQFSVPEIALNMTDRCKRLFGGINHTPASIGRTDDSIVCGIG